MPQEGPSGGGIVGRTAALCAHDQGKFFEYQALLYANQKRLEDGQLLEYARSASIDHDAFGACLRSVVNSSSSASPGVLTNQARPMSAPVSSWSCRCRADRSHCDPSMTPLPR